MDWENVLAYVIQTLCEIAITVGIPYIISIAVKHFKNEYATKMIERAGGIVTSIVLLVNQTYVDALKAEGKFGKTEQEIAFAQCKEQVLAMLNEEAKKAIVDAFGDLDAWLKAQIEANVRDNKQSSGGKVNTGSEKPGPDHTISFAR